MGRAIALALATVAAAVVASNASAAALSPFESHVVAQINHVREQHGLGPLRLSVKLNEAAHAHSLQMAHDGYFAHESADGSAFWKRIGTFYSSSPWSYWSVGENLLWEAPDVSPARAVQLWLASPEHRKNLLTSRWREIGISAVHVGAAPGVYEGLPVTIVTTDFGVRR